MRIAFCHNLKTSDALEEAEFDTPETVERLRRALEASGHAVLPVNLNGSVSDAAARLETWRPDLVFNTAEGRRGRLREAFYPALFEELGLPFTGGSAACCALTLDKAATKERVARLGVPTPRAVFVTLARRADVERALDELRWPVIVKPNFEGSSVGVSTRSVCSNRAELQARLGELLSAFPDGLLVEELIAGRDVTVGFLEALDPPVLDPTGYTYLDHGRNPYNIYSYELKNTASDLVQVDADPGLPVELAARIRSWALLAARELEVHDLARFDFRVTPHGEAFFLEANALPSLEEGAGLLVAAERRGLGYDAVIDGVVASAARRHGLPLMRSLSPRRGHRVGLVFNLKRTDVTVDDTEAEFDTPRTIALLGGALVSLGHEVVELEALPDLLRRLPAAGVDVVFNLAEGRGGRNREAVVPALCEFLRIPCTGSDAATMAIALDKALAKRLLAAAGVPTPGFQLFTSSTQRLDPALRFPLIAKPNAEGTSKGLSESNVVLTEIELRGVLERLLERYDHSVIVEEYVAGRELTVGLVGWPRPRCLEPMEIRFLDASVKRPVYSYELKQDFSSRTSFECPARLTAPERGLLEETARNAFDALGCRDIARVDFRLPHGGVPQVLEVNPLPGLSKGFSDLCLVAEGNQLPYENLVAEILAGALTRGGLTPGSR